MRYRGSHSAHYPPIMDCNSFEKGKRTIILFSRSAVPSGITPDAKFNCCYIKYSLDYIPQGAAFSWIKTLVSRWKQKCRSTWVFSQKASNVPLSLPPGEGSQGFHCWYRKLSVCVCVSVHVCACASSAWGHLHRCRLCDRWYCSPGHNEYNCQIRIQPTAILMVLWITWMGGGKKKERKKKTDITKVIHTTETEEAKPWLKNYTWKISTRSTAAIISRRKKTKKKKIKW